MNLGDKTEVGSRLSLISYSDSFASFVLTYSFVGPHLIEFMYKKNSQ